MLFCYIEKNDYKLTEKKKLLLRYTIEGDLYIKVNEQSRNVRLLIALNVHLFILGISKYLAFGPS